MKHTDKERIDWMDSQSSLWADLDFETGKWLIHVVQGNVNDRYLVKLSEGKKDFREAIDEAIETDEKTK